MKLPKQQAQQQLKNCATACVFESEAENLQLKWETKPKNVNKSTEFWRFSTSKEYKDKNIHFIFIMENMIAGENRRAALKWYLSNSYVPYYVHFVRHKKIHCWLLLNYNAFTIFVMFTQGGRRLSEVIIYPIKYKLVKWFG